MEASDSTLTLNSSVYSFRKIAIILDTDIGEFIGSVITSIDSQDDHFALALLLRSPEVDIKLISIAGVNTPIKAAIVAKFLTTAKVLA